MNKKTTNFLIFGTMFLVVIAIFAIIGYCTWIISEDKPIIPTYNFEDLFEKNLSFTTTYSGEPMTIDLAENGKINVNTSDFNIYYLDTNNEPLKDNEGNLIDNPINAGNYKVKIESKTLLESDGITFRAAFINFIINKATPIIDTSKLTIQNTSGINYITTETNPSSISLVDNANAIYHDESPNDSQIPGTIVMEEKVFVIGLETRSCTFIPTDTYNFEIVDFEYNINTYAMVKFYSDGSLYETQYIVLNETAQDPSNQLIKDKYSLMGWRLEENDSHFDFKTNITSNINLNAHWGHSIILIDNLSNTQIGETQYIEHGMALSTTIEFPSSQADYQYTGAYVWTKDGVEISNDYIVNENIQIVGSRDLRIYPTVNIYYKDKDNQVSSVKTNTSNNVTSYNQPVYDFVSKIGITTNNNITFGTEINLSKQIRLNNEYTYYYTQSGNVTSGSRYINGFYMSPISTFDWNTLATNGNDDCLIYYTDDFSVLNIVILCVQPQAIVSKGAITSTETFNDTSGLYYAKMNDAFDDVKDVTENTYLRIYGQAFNSGNVFSYHCRNTDVSINSYSFSIDSHTYTIPKYTVYGKTDYTLNSYTSINTTTDEITYDINSHLSVILPYARSDTSLSGYRTQNTTADPNAGGSYVQSILIIPENAILIVNGTLTVGGDIYGGGAGTIASHAVLMNNGTINVNTTLNSYGYIKGTGMVNASNGSTITDVLRIYDWPGGANALGEYQKNIFPFNCYSFHNISCSLRINYGAQFQAWAQIYMASQFATALNMCLVGSGGLFELTSSSGYIIKTVEDTTKNTNINSSFTTSNQDVTQRDVMNIFGDFKDNIVSVIIKVLGTQTISTSTEMAMPIGFMKIIINSGNGILSKNSYKFLPGSNLYIDKNAIVTIDSGVNIIFYDEYSDDYSYINGSTTTSGYTNPYSYRKIHSAIYSATTTINSLLSSDYQAKCIIDGKLICNGSIGGVVENTGSGTLILSNNSATLKKLSTLTYGSLGGTATVFDDIQYVRLYLYQGLSVSSNLSNASTGTYYGIEYDGRCGWYSTEAIINYELNGGLFNGNNTIDSITRILDDNGYTIMLSDLPAKNLMVKDYYIFDNWYLDLECTIPAEGSVIFSNMTLYAKWIPIEYDIIYNISYESTCTNTGTMNNANPTKYTIEDVIYLVEPTESNYVFDGWYSDENYSSKITSIIGSQYNGTTIHVYARFYPYGTTSYNVEYVSDNADYVLPSETVLNDNASSWQAPNTSNTFTKNLDKTYEYYFDGWYLDLDYEVPFDGVLNSDIILYAKWLHKTTVNITIDAGLGNLNPSATYYINPNQSVTIPVTASMIPPSSDLTGYEFTGWSCSNGLQDGKNLIEGESYILSDKWDQIITIEGAYLLMWIPVTITIGSNVTSVTITNTTSGVVRTYETSTSNITDLLQYGDKFTISGKVATDYNFDSPQVSGVSGTGPYEVTSTEEITINTTATKPSSCIDPYSLILMADGTYKYAKDVELGELVVTWDFENGRYSIQPIIYAEKVYHYYYEIILYFNDGSKSIVQNQHTLFDLDALDYQVIQIDTVASCVGKRFFKYASNNEVSEKILVDYEISFKYGMECEFVTAYDLNFFFDDLLSAEGMLLTHTFFKVDKNFKYVEEEKLADIEKYGLYTYEEWSDILSYEQFQLLMGEYYKIYVGKGYADIEYLKYMISRFLKDPHYDSN